MGDGGRKIRIDFLDDSRPNTHEEVIRDAVGFRTIDGAPFRIMHPVSCLKSRVHNVVVLASQYDNPHGRRQLEAAIKVVPEFCKWILESGAPDAPRKVLSLYKLVFKFSCGLEAKKLRKNRGIEVFTAIQILEGLPDDFAQKGYPHWIAEIERR